MRFFSGLKNRFRHRLEEHRCVALWSSLADNHQLAFDVGANVGLKARAMARIFRRVLAFEPDPDCFSHLESLSSRIAGIDPYRVALGEKAGPAVLYRSSNSVLNSVSRSWIQAVERSGRFGDATWDRKGLSVSVETLEYFIEEVGLPDFIKIDAEGFEEPIIKGIISIPRLVCFEFTPETLPSTLRILQEISERWDHEANFCSRDRYKLELPCWLHPVELGSKLESLAQSSRLSWGDIYVRPRRSEGDDVGIPRD